MISLGTIISCKSNTLNLIMADITDPNQALAKEIVLALKAKGLILDQNADSLTTYLAEGKMKDATWKKAFENKIAAIKTANEA